MRGRGHGLEIHRILAERYGAVACETFCSNDEMRVLESMARRRSQWRLSAEHGPMALGRPAISRAGAWVHQMIVGRLGSRPEPA